MGDFVVAVALSLAFGFVLSLAIKASYLGVFAGLRKPNLWAGLLGILGFCWVYAASLFTSLDVTAGAVLLALLFSIRTRTAMFSDADVSDFFDMTTGVPNTLKKRRLGLYSFVIGCVVSWVVIYGQGCDERGFCRPLLSVVLGN